ncbi:hypothetical protein HD597_002011 [Nonomuraea thailandensis]|uniref:Uncharacterized protein n=1 Tax=Nonomuraea thailandensis TaxID=1188745 RepID=A0A9X2GGK5_9ACTN|nr:hypothetical protein [Nonomuraea thailandensis]MCP2354991.1 hypothetical protein [Nonomuraea thailandensis]
MITVYVTAQGDKYHSAPDCIGLTSGQEGGEVQDYNLNPIVPKDLEEAAKKWKPCKLCRRGAA